MADNRAVLEVEQDQEQEVIAKVWTSNSRMAEKSFLRSTTGVYAAGRERSVATARAAAMSTTPILLTIAAYGGAVCVGVWACLNLLHWFWRQLQ